MDRFASVPTLSGRHVRLEPLHAGHADALVRAAADGDLWNLRVTRVPAADTVEAYIAQALAEQAAGTCLPFVVRDAGGEVVGSTRCFALDRAVPRLEIGYTWYATRVQRTGLNTEAKRLLLGFAFDTLDCALVEFRTHVENQRSRDAIQRLGAHFDGVLRRHLRMPDGHVRDTAVYSILREDWPAVRDRLDTRLAQGVSA